MPTRKSNRGNAPFNLSRSFSNRVAVITAFVAGAIFLLLSLFSGLQSRKVMEENAKETAYTQLGYINLEIGSLLAEISNTVTNLAPMITDELERSTIDSATLCYYIHQIVESNNKLLTCNVGIEPGGRYGHPFKSYCAMRGEKGKIAVKQIASDSFLYNCMDWYVIPKELHEPYWTDPYLSNVYAGKIITLYSYPIYGQGDELLGVVSVTMPVSYFSRYVRVNSAYDDSYNFMLGADASFIVYPDEHNLLSHTIFSLHADEKDSTWHDIGRDMMAGHRGEAMVKEHGKRYYVFYAPILGIGWSAAIVYSAQDIFADSNRLISRMLLYSIVAILALLFVARGIVKRIARPVIEMSDTARRVADGDFHAPLPDVNTNDELMVLHDSLQMMQDSLSNYMGQILHNAAVQQRMNSELDMARNIQLGILPQFTDTVQSNPYFDIHALLRPARSVGGDLYDFYLIDNYLYTMVADVSGKGFPAALLMVETRSMLRSIVQKEHHPGQILHVLNNAIMETNKADMFITMFISRLDIQTGELVFSNAGHNPPMLVRHDGTVEEIACEPNLMLGSIDGWEYEQQSINLAPGDLMYLYTDGVSEAENSKHELFGIEAIAEELRHVFYLDARRIVAAVDEAMLRHASNYPQSDDITAMAFRYHTPERAPRECSRVLVMQTLDDLTPLAQMLEELGERLNIPMDEVLALNLALEEVAVNVMRYSHPDTDVLPPFEIHVSCVDEVLQFVMTDDGVPFDPTGSEEVDTDLPIEERTIGGLGIHLTRQIMDSMEYHRYNGLNVLRMCKRIIHEPPTEE